MIVAGSALYGVTVTVVSGMILPPPPVEGVSLHFGVLVSDPPVVKG